MCIRIYEAFIAPELVVLFYRSSIHEFQKTLTLLVPKTCTVRELKEIICCKLSNGPFQPSISPDHLFLSHNGSDELSNSSLRSVGVISGDLFCCSLNPYPDEFSEALESERKEFNCVSVSRFLNKAFVDWRGNLQLWVLLGSDAGGVVVHVVLLEFGFVGYNPVSSTKLDRFRSGSSPLHYTIPQVLLSSKSDQNLVVVKFQILGEIVHLNGSLANTNTTRTRAHLDASLLGPVFNLVWKNGNHIMKTTHRDVVEFWKQVKDEFVLPLSIDLYKSAGLVPPSNLHDRVGVTPPPSSFMPLPTDLKLKILELLPGKDIAKAECLCAQLWSICSDNNLLWKRKYEQEFGTGKVVGTTNSVHGN